MLIGSLVRLFQWLVGSSGAEMKVWKSTGSVDLAVLESVFGIDTLEMHVRP